MSGKERDRLTILAGVPRQELTLVPATDLPGLGYRLTKRVWRRYQARGDAGLVHRLRGKPPALGAQVLARFFEEETTRASYDVFEGWVRRHGLPRSLYVDRDSICRCQGVASIAGQLAGKAPQTQFGRAMEPLSVGT